MRAKYKLLGACMCMATLSTAYASDDIRWNGYLNVVGGILKDEPRADDTREKQYPAYGLYEDQFSFDPQTSGGLQASKVLDEQTLVTAQIFGEGRSNSYTASLKWLYLTWNPNENSTFRIGKIGSPTYYFSDFLNVGFAYPWASLPVEVYAYDNTITGIDYVYRNFAGDLEWSAEVIFGSGDEEVAEGINAESKNLTGLVLTGVWDGWLTGRVGVVSSDVTIVSADLQPDAILDSALAQIQTDYGLDDNFIGTLRDANLASLQEKLDYEDKKATYADAFLRADMDSWLVWAEVTYAESDAYLSDSTLAWYLSGGYRISDALVYLTYSKTDGEMTREAENDLVAEPSDIAALIGSNVAIRSVADRKSTAVGVRFDTSMNTAVKVELTQFEETASVSGETAGIGKNLLFRTALNVSF